MMCSEQAPPTGPDPRDAFDVSAISGMRGRLAALYASFRQAEAATNRTRAAPSAGGRIGEYRERACPACDKEPGATSTLVSAHGMVVVCCARCGFVYARAVLDASSDAARYRASDIDQVTMELRDSAPYLEIERARSRYYLDQIAAAGIRPGSLIEIGCGSGTFLMEAASRGWDGLGIDPGMAAAEQARTRGARVVDGYFPQDLPDPNQRVDFIAMLDVLEHVVEPRGFLRQIRERLNPGGVLFVQVPNWDSLLIQVEGERSTIVAPGHWSYFTRATLTDLLESEGFNLLQAETVVSEIDRIACYPAAEVAAAWLRLRPDAPQPDPLRPADLYRLDLGYKLICVFRST